MTRPEETPIPEWQENRIVQAIANALVGSVARLDDDQRRILGRLEELEGRLGELERRVHTVETRVGR